MKKNINKNYGKLLSKLVVSLTFIFVLSFFTGALTITDDGISSDSPTNLDLGGGNISNAKIKLGEGTPTNELVWINSSPTNNRGLYIIGTATELTYDLVRLNPLNGQRALFIDQDGEGGSLIIDSESTSNTSFNVDAENTILSSVKFTNNAAAISGSVLAILATNPAHAGNGLSINYDGTGDALVIETDSITNPAFNIDTSKYGMSVTSTVNGGYAGLFKTSATSTASPSGGALKVLIDNAADTAPALVVQNDGSGKAISVTRGNITIDDLSGSGNAFACFDSNGKLYRSAVVCS